MTDACIGAGEKYAEGIFFPPDGREAFFKQDFSMEIFMFWGERSRSHKYITVMCM
jgi:hypothetical protein